MSKKVTPDFINPVTGEQEPLLPRLDDWLREVYNEAFDYIASMTRRASNLVALMRQQPSTPESPVIITENALLMYTEEIVSKYMECGSFPSIAILDDILVHGRNTNRFLSQFWAVIAQYLHRVSPQSDLEAAEEQFNASITLWVFAANAAPTLLRHEFQWKMRYQFIMTERQWRYLSNSIISLLEQNGIENTAFVISKRVSSEAPKQTPSSEHWLTISETKYRGKSQDFYCFQLAPHKNVYPCVRCYELGRYQYYIPSFFMPELNSHQVHSTLTALFACIPETKRSKNSTSISTDMINLLNQINKCSERLTVYAQLLSLLLSQITLSIFLQDIYPGANIPFTTAAADTAKIACNFGDPADIKPLLDGFFSIHWKAVHLAAILDQMGIEKCDAPYQPLTPQDRLEIVPVIEQIVYKQAVDHERSAVEWERQQNSDITPDQVEIYKSGEIGLSEFLTRVKADNRIAGIPNNDLSVTLPILSCITQMIDRGDISIKARVKPADDMKPIIYYAVRTTEMSLAILPRKLQSHYHEFFDLAQFYWRDPDFPVRIEQYFKDALSYDDFGNSNEKIVETASFFAKMIYDNPIIINSMLNWRVLFQ